MTVRSFNYTNRKEIKVTKAFTLEITNEDVNFVELKMTLNSKMFKEYDFSTSKLILDAYSWPHHYRQTIAFKDSQTVRFSEFGKDNTVRYTLRVVDEDGNILGASSEFSPKQHSFKHIERDNFFQPIPADLGDLFWKIDWNGGSPQNIYINKKILILHNDNKQDPLLQGYFLQSIFKEVLTGIIVRNPDSYIEDLDKPSFSWITFCKEKLEINPPNDVLDISNNNQDKWFEYIDDCYNEFCAHPWRAGKCLLDSMIEKGA